MKAAIAVALALGLAGCATSAAPPPTEDATAELIAARSGAAAGSGPAATPPLPGHNLTATEAVRVALARNAGFGAALAAIGLAQADLVQAGLAPNPDVSASLRFPDGPPGLTNAGFSLAQSLTAWITRPARQRVAAAQAEATRLQTAAAGLDLVAEVRRAYVQLRAARGTAALLRDRAGAADAAAALAARLHEAGNLSELDLARLRADAEATRAEYADALAASAADREELNRLMGVAGPDAAAWTAPDELPPPPLPALPERGFERAAILADLRLDALRHEAEASAASLGLARDYGWLTDVQLGVSTEKQAEGYRVTGPTLSFALPLFDRGQAARLRAEAALRQNEARLAVEAVDTRARARALRERLIRLADLARRYESVVVPLQRRIVALGLRQYNFMLLGPFDLLRARQDEIAASRRLIEARRDLWLGLVDLDRAMAGAPPYAFPADITQPTQETHA